MRQCRKVLEDGEGALVTGLVYLYDMRAKKERQGGLRIKLGSARPRNSLLEHL